MARKVFEFEEKPATVAPEFELAGEVFHGVADTELSTLDVLDYITGLGAGGITTLRTAAELFDTMIEPGDLDRFRKTLKTARVPLSPLAEVASWLLNEYLRFPTQEVGQSSNGSATDGSPSPVVSLVPPDAT